MEAFGEVAKLNAMIEGAYYTGATDDESTRLVRSYTQSQIAWYPNRFNKYRKISTGKVDGVEAEDASLVIRPNGHRRLQRDFATMAGSTGESWVSLVVTR